MRVYTMQCNAMQYNYSIAQQYNTMLVYSWCKNKKNMYIYKNKNIIKEKLGEAPIKFPKQINK